MCKFLIIFSSLLVACLSFNNEAIRNYNFINYMVSLTSPPFNYTFVKFANAMMEFLQNDISNNQSTIKNFLTHFETFHKDASVDLDFEKTVEGCLPDCEDKRDDHKKLLGFYDCFMQREIIWILKQIEEGLNKTIETKDF